MMNQNESAFLRFSDNAVPWPAGCLPGKSGRICQIERFFWRVVCGMLTTPGQREAVRRNFEIGQKNTAKRERYRRDADWNRAGKGEVKKQLKNNEGVT